MNVDITLKGVSLEDAAKIVAMLSGSSAAVESKPAAKAERNKPKAEDKAEEPKAEEPAEEASDAPTKEEVTAAAQKFAAKNGREALAELLAEFGAKNLSGIAEKQRSEFIAAVEDKIEA